MKEAPYSIGSDQWPGLAKLLEETGEVQQVIGKLLAVRGEAEHWDGTNLHSRFEEELGDLLAAVEYVLRHNPTLSREHVYSQKTSKTAVFELWHQESE